MVQLVAVAGTGEWQDHGRPISGRIAGLTELSFELEDGHQGHGGGTGLVRDALTAIPSGQLVLAAVAPGNAASVRALLSAGFIPSAPSSRRPVAGDDQHADNTNKTALPGTQRHDRHDGHASLVISENAGELG